MLQPFIAILLLSFVFADTALAKSPRKKLPEILQAYAATIRWGEFSEALAFVDPTYLKHNSPTKLELDRYQQVRVSYYHDSIPVFLSPEKAQVTAEIGLININTQSARSIVDKQIWQWDKKTKRWWLMTGLPDITQR